MSGAYQRCTNPKNASYPHYGGSGVQFRFSSIAAAAAWVITNLGRRPTPRHSIHRIDNENGHYEPGGIKWATPAEQTRNQRTNVIANIEQANEIRALYQTGRYIQKELATMYEVSTSTIYQIIHDKSWLPENPVAIAREIDFCSVVRALINELDRIGAPAELRLIARRMAREYRAPLRAS
jgi:hypothetical protein